MQPKHEIIICLGSSCFSRGSKNILKTIKTYLNENNLEDEVFFHGQLCMGMCEKGPNMKIDNREFHGVNEENVIGILNDVFH